MDQALHRSTDLEQAMLGEVDTLQHGRNDPTAVACLDRIEKQIKEQAGLIRQVRRDVQALDRFHWELRA